MTSWSLPRRVAASWGRGPRHRHCQRTQTQHGGESSRFIRGDRIQCLSYGLARPGTGHGLAWPGTPSGGGPGAVWQPASLVPASLSWQPVPVKDLTAPLEAAWPPARAGRALMSALRRSGASSQRRAVYRVPSAEYRAMPTAALRPTGRTLLPGPCLLWLAAVSSVLPRSEGLPSFPRCNLTEPIPSP